MHVKIITALIFSFIVTGAPNFASAACGGNITVDEDGGNITSPNFPKPYPYNTMCEWHIIVSDNMQIVLKFQSFQLESNRDSRKRCNDFVEIQDVGSLNSSLIGPYCGTENPPVINSTGNELYVKFSSDNSFNYNGFKAVYSRVCKKENQCRGSCNPTGIKCTDDSSQNSSTPTPIGNAAMPSIAPSLFSLTSIFFLNLLLGTLYRF